MQNKTSLKYLTLFSGAGVGCFGFKMENFNCVATVEILEKRLRIQQYNNKCIYDTANISGDLTKPETKEKIFSELERWNIGNQKRDDLDVLVATPLVKECPSLITKKEMSFSATR